MPHPIPPNTPFAEAMAVALGLPGTGSGLDLESGRQDIHLDLETEAAVLDQGNNHVIAADGSIIYGGKQVMVRLFNLTYGP